MGNVLAQADSEVKHYHADNGRFADNEFLEAANDSVESAQQ